MEGERYSHVMHLSSTVTGRLAPGRDSLDAVRATFPAGTLSGAPKISAMQIIAALEPERRGPYGGAVGYVGFGGNLDLAITLRTIVIAAGVVVGYFVLGEATPILGTHIGQLADPTAAIDPHDSSKQVVTVSPEVEARDVAATIARYDVLAVPVVDDHGKMLGIVTVDDAIDAIMPKPYLVDDGVKKIEPYIG